MTNLTQTIKTGYANGVSFSVETNPDSQRWDFVCAGAGFATLTDGVCEYTVNTAGNIIGVESCQ
jgi:hypothetical protein